jgi:four helix bundle protein
VTPDALRERLTAFAVECVTLCVDLRRRPEARQIVDQLSRSATSTAASYRAACRARSRREFLSRIGLAIEDADEAVGWLEILVRSGLADADRTVALRREASEVLAILAASGRPATGRRR